MSRSFATGLSAALFVFGCGSPADDATASATDPGTGTEAGEGTFGPLDESTSRGSGRGDEGNAQSSGDLSESSSGSVDCPEFYEEFGYTGAIQTIVLPDCLKTVQVRVQGAAGGRVENSLGTRVGGLGAFVVAELDVPPGLELSVVVGESPPTVSVAGGGGGASFVAFGDEPIAVAGGGGGASPAYNGASTQFLSQQGPGVGGDFYAGGSGGAGWSEDGQGKAGGQSLREGAAGGVSDGPPGEASSGGFGGGGAAGWSSEAGGINFYDPGGGGGFDGGDAADFGAQVAGRGGTSYVDSAARLIRHVLAADGDPHVVIRWPPP